MKHITAEDTKRRKAAGTVLAIGIFAAGSVADAASLTAGSYVANVYVAETLSAPGVVCLDPSGTSYFGVVHYGGVDAATLTMHLALSGIPAVISRQVLTVTHGVGTDAPEGTFVAHLSNGGGATGTFSASLQPFDNVSFTGSLIENAPALGCTERLEISLVRMPSSNFFSGP